MTTTLVALRPTVLFSAAMLPLISACSNAPAAERDAAPRAPAVSVSVEHVMSGANAAPVTATGTFGSRDEIPLAFKIGGIVSRVLVDEGATVQRGQLLASLDLREINAAVAKARAWDDWKDTHPFGYGNSQTNPCPPGQMRGPASPTRLKKY